MTPVGIAMQRCIPLPLQKPLPLLPPKPTPLLLPQPDLLRRSTLTKSQSDKSPPLRLVVW